MHPVRLLLACLALVCCRAPGSSPLPEARADESPPAAGAVAVVELFTSEGCSSCPPADAVLADLARAQARGVLALAFHVDYWDGLGWPDWYATPLASGRQREYARSFRADGVYTPQMIVGGTDEFAGSNRERADAAIARALARAQVARLSVVARRSGADTLSVDFVVSGAPEGTRLTVAVVQRAASTAVRAGENAGRTLRHANVVRAFVELPVTAPRGTATLTLPGTLAWERQREEGEVIAYLQRAPAAGGGMPVIAGTATPLP